MYEFIKPLPKYKCHKIVGALKIADVKRSARDRWVWELHFEPAEYGMLEMSAQWIDKHRPVAGGYLVQYSDEYVSYSPAAQFEEGYARVES